MKLEDLEYPWRKDLNPDLDSLRGEIEQLKREMIMLRDENFNLKTFCQSLYDRLDMRNGTYISSVNKPY